MVIDYTVTINKALRQVLAISISHFFHLCLHVCAEIATTIQLDWRGDGQQEGRDCCVFMSHHLRLSPDSDPSAVWSVFDCRGRLHIDMNLFNNSDIRTSGHLNKDNRPFSQQPFWK